MASLIQRARGAGRYAEVQGAALQESQYSAASGEYAPTVASTTMRPRDRNAPDHRLQFNSMCIYERALPGNAYVTCHVDRLQSGFYDSEHVHEDLIDNVRFVALHFVFHSASTVNRFRKATISVSVRKGAEKRRRSSTRSGSRPARSGSRPASRLSNAARALTGSPESTSAGEKKHARINPSILRHAPHVLYGSISPESLQWNFNLAGSIGVNHGPASASVQPSGGWKSSYKVYEMMRIQGSSRTYRGSWGPDDDVEDGEVVWTLEENGLQRSGLPREFTFVILLQKGEPDVETLFDIRIDPIVNGAMGIYPLWFVNSMPQYRPMLKPRLDLDHEIGQLFGPSSPGAMGFNFADVSCSFEDFVTLPGTLYSTSEMPLDDGSQPSKTDSTKTPTSSRPLQNSILLGQARLPRSDSVHQRPPYPQTPHDQQAPQGFTQATNSSGQPAGKATAAQQAQGYQQNPQYPSSLAPLFPNNTLNVRVTVEKAASSPSPTLRSPVSARGSQRTSHSLRRSRSRTGLEREFGEITPAASSQPPQHHYSPTHADEWSDSAERYIAHNRASAVAAAAAAALAEAEGSDLPGAVGSKRHSMPPVSHPPQSLVQGQTPMRNRSYVERGRPRPSVVIADPKEATPSPSAAAAAAGGPQARQQYRERLARVAADNRYSYPGPRNFSA